MFVIDCLTQSFRAGVQIAQVWVKSIQKKTSSSFELFHHKRAPQTHGLDNASAITSTVKGT